FETPAEQTCVLPGYSQQDLVQFLQDDQAYAGVRQCSPCRQVATHGSSSKDSICSLCRTRRVGCPAQIATEVVTKRLDL
ncbi:hypothetical protein M5D96_009113, partial [Drosophila gunungcola]